MQARLGFPHSPGAWENPSRPVATAAFPVASFPRDPLPAFSGVEERGGGWVLGGARPAAAEAAAAAEPKRRAAGRPDPSLSPAAATMRRKGTKPSTACHQEEGPPPSQDGAHSEGEMEQPAGGANCAASAGECPAGNRVRRKPSDTHWGWRGAGDRLTSEARESHSVVFKGISCTLLGRFWKG